MIRRKTMNRDEIIKVAENMKMFGGYFFGLLADALLQADEVNAHKIKYAFREEWDQFLEMSNG